jgi:phenylpyruvate tautomerase PptA (4-oxalocrotonate tautomerase family)
MPYISVTLGQKLRAVQKEKLKAELGRIVSGIPGKNEANLIVNVHDSDAMYMGGAEVPCAFIEFRVHSKIPLASKKEFSKKLFAFIAKEFGVPPEHQYLDILEYEHWGYDGEWH